MYSEHETEVPASHSLHCAHAVRIAVDGCFSSNLERVASQSRARDLEVERCFLALNAQGTLDDPTPVLLPDA